MDGVDGMAMGIYVLVRREEMLNAQRIVSQLLPSSVPSFLERLKDALGLILENVYSVFKFASMPNLQFRISKLLKTVL